MQMGDHAADVLRRGDLAEASLVPPTRTRGCCRHRPQPGCGRHRPASTSPVCRARSVWVFQSTSTFLIEFDNKLRKRRHAVGWNYLSRGGQARDFTGMKPLGVDTVAHHPRRGGRGQAEVPVIGRHHKGAAPTE